jgi:hypothetical protein
MVVKISEFLLKNEKKKMLLLLPGLEYKNLTMAARAWLTWGCKTNFSCTGENERILFKISLIYMQEKESYSAEPR